MNERPALNTNMTAATAANARVGMVDFTSRPCWLHTVLASARSGTPTSSRWLILSTLRLQPSGCAYSNVIEYDPLGIRYDLVDRSRGVQHMTVGQLLDQI